jgi:hypothetical protein
MGEDGESGGKNAVLTRSTRRGISASSKSVAPPDLLPPNPTGLQRVVADRVIKLEWDLNEDATVMVAQLPIRATFPQRRFGNGWQFAKIQDFRQKLTPL